MAQEREIKLALRPRDAAKLTRHPLLAPLTATPQLIISRYFDTPEQRLAQAGIAVRVRRDGAAFFATVKCASGDASGFTDRAEWEISLPASVAQPHLFAATPPPPHDWLEPLLAQIDRPDLSKQLTATAATWQPVLTTRFRRTRWQLPLVGGAAEIALDRGTITAGNQSLPLCEVEIESATAPLAELYALARQLADQVPLWPEPRSKAARGNALLAGTALKPVKADPPRWGKRASVGDAFWQAWSETVAQGAANLSLYATTHDPEALHQLRVALRRARVLVRLFAPWLGRPLAQKWQEALKTIAEPSGGTRDRDVLLSELVAPTLTYCPVAPEAVAALRDALTARHRPITPPYGQLGCFWLEAATQLAARLATEPAEPLLPFLARRLERLRSRVVDRIAQWRAEPSGTNRHRVRIALKAWRYALEWSEGLLPTRTATQQLARAKRALDLLGAAQDWESAALQLSPWLARNDALAVGAAVVLAWQHAQRIPAADQILDSLAEWLAEPLPRL